MCGNLHVAWQWKGRAKIFVGLTAWLHVVSKVVGQCKIKPWEKVVYPRNSDHAMFCWHGRLDTIQAVSIT